MILTFLLFLAFSAKEAYALPNAISSLEKSSSDNLPDSPVEPDWKLLPPFQENIGSFSIIGGKPDATIFKSGDVELLPVGASTSSILEYWYLPSVVSNLDKGGFASTEPLTVNTHGGSALWQKYWFENMDISHPLDRGKPFIDLPLKSWDFFSVHSLLSNYGNFSGYHWKLFTGKKTEQAKPKKKSMSPADDTHSLEANLALTSLMGGDSLVAKGLFDREPVQLWGAPEERRHFLPSYEGTIHYEGLGLFSRPLIAFTEVLSHNRSFLQIGNQVENNYRISSVFVQELNDKHTLFLLYQGLIREYAGVEKTQSVETSLEEYQHNFVLHLNSKKLFEDEWVYHVAMGFGFGDQKARQNESNFSIQDEIIRGTPDLPRTHQVFFTDFSIMKEKTFIFKNFFDTSIGVSSPVRFELTSKQYSLENTRVIRYDENIPLDVLLHEASSNQIDMLFRLRPKIFSESSFKAFKFEVEFGVLSENIFSDSGSGFYRIEPTVLLRLTYCVIANRLELIFGVQHDAIPATLQESEFLNENSVASRRERWIDTNGDERFQLGEEVGVLQRSGGGTHEIDSKIKHPVLEELFIGAEFRFSAHWQAFVNLTGKWHRNLYWVDYAEGFLSGYREVERNDINSGKLYDRSPGSYGQEKYALTNRDSDSYFAGLDFQILKEAITSWWFINITVGLYVHLANNLVGNGVENNDIGRYSELSADPNRNFNLFGRTDYDRGYVANLLFGFNLWKGFTWTNTIHYRDGLPFGSFITVRGLSQSSLPVMSNKRANGLSGISRYTFYLNWDARIRYNYKNYSIVFDVYNLLESSTETLENPFIDKNRRPLDSTTPRSFRFMFSYRWG